MDFTQALKTPAADIEPPKLLPVGTYIMAVTKQYDHKVVGKDEDWDMITFPCKIISPTDDIDPDDLDEFGNVAGTPTSVRFMVSKNPDDTNGQARAIEQIKRFLYDSLQVDVDESAPLAEAMAAAPNCQFLGVVQHNPDKNDPNVVYVEVRKTGPVD